MSKTKKFSTDSAFRNWLRRNGYSKDTPPRTGVYTSGGSRVGSAFRKGRGWEVDIY